MKILMLIATAILEKEGHDVRFIDGAALNLKREDIRNEIALMGVALGLEIPKIWD